jgi:hypothetical protein
MDCHSCDSCASSLRVVVITMSPSSHGQKYVYRFVAVALLLGYQYGQLFCFTIYNTTNNNNNDARSVGSSNKFSLPYFKEWLYFGDSTSSSTSTITRSSTPIASSLVHASYQQTFVLLEKCSKEEPFRDCLTRLYQGNFQNQQSATTSTSASASTTENSSSSLPQPPPWWFQTMVRDVRVKGLGWWHDVEIADPPLHFCKLEKVASTEFRGMACLANQFNISSRSCRLEQHLRPDYDTAPRAVFLRDPLERFLSAFLDKCIARPDRMLEHCEPKGMYFVGPYKTASPRAWAESLVRNPRLFFDAYVDTLPLKWNVHFFPQALYCDGLFRHFASYDFVGNMSKSVFRSELQRMGERYHSQGSNTTTTTTNLATSIQEAFRLSPSFEELQKTPRSSDAKVGNNRTIATSSKVLEYYTPRTVRKVLQYVSIDYVQLNLPIPAWAEEMLRQDNSYKMLQHQLF